MTVIASRPYLTKDERQRFADTFGGRPVLERYCESCGMLPAWCECVDPLADLKPITARECLKGTLDDEPERCQVVLPFSGFRCQYPAGHDGWHGAGDMQDEGEPQ